MSVDQHAGPPTIESAIQQVQAEVDKLRDRVARLELAYAPAPVPPETVDWELPA